MDLRSDTSLSSGRFRGQWSFLAHPPSHSHSPSQPRSLPPSSYIPPSERSSVSLLSPGVYHRTANGSRSSLPQNLTTTSVGGRSSTTIPSQPVLLRVHSANASRHSNPAPRPMRPLKTNKNGLPVLSEFSLQGILDAIQEDVEQDVNTISEILGRSRLVLADHHDSHMPPQGEIRARPTSSLQAVEEASTGDEQLAMMPSDEVVILRDDASLVYGSQAGSAAYNLLERLQAIPRTPGVHSEMPTAVVPGSPNAPRRHSPSPARLRSDDRGHAQIRDAQARRSSRQLLQSSSGRARSQRATPAVSETYLSAGADGTQRRESPALLGDLDYQLPMVEAENYTADNVVHEGCAYSYGSGVNGGTSQSMFVSDPTGFDSWLQVQRNDVGRDPHSSAEGRLRGLLQR